jgi:uncharacterized membrane protein YphA (DoxX/SURF4 family)
MRKKSIIFLILRISLGWHFLYEGLTKVIDPHWTAEAYLRGSSGIFSPFFHFLSSGPGMITAVDFLNEWGLILVGSALILGVFVRMASVSGILLLMLYYFAYPPFGHQSADILSEGHFWIINRNLIEALVFLVIYLFPSSDYSILNISSFYRKRKLSPTPVENVEEHSRMDRRTLIKGVATLPVFGGIVGAALLRDYTVNPDALSGATVALKRYDLKDLRGSLPKGKLADIEMSRVILGCNLMGGGAHSRDLEYVHDLSRYYNTEKKIFETLSLCEQAGIDSTNMVSGHFKLFNRYKMITGSNMKTVCQLHLRAGSKDPFLELRQLTDHGATTMYIQGANADTLVKNDRLDLIEEALELIRLQGLPAGIGAHSIEVLIACVNAGIKPDYYYKTMHHDRYWSAHPMQFREEFSVDGQRSLDHNKIHDNMFDLFPDRTIDVISNIDVPVVGFKVLAAGAIKPKDGFRYAFENGADFICVGMFDWQVVENVNTAIEVLGSELKRERKWIG